MKKSDDERFFEVELRPIEWALATYYSERRHSTPTDFVSHVVNIYSNADQNFDSKDFLNYVRNELLTKELDLKSRGIILKDIVRYARARHEAEEETRSLAGPSPVLAAATVVDGKKIRRR